LRGCWSRGRAARRHPEELVELAERYGDARRTHITAYAEKEFGDEDFVDEERVLIPITQRGYIKRVPSDVYRTQGRGGRGVMGMTTRDEDAIIYMFSANTLNTLLFFTDQGKVFQERVYQIPEADRTAKGSLIAGILALGAEERVTAVLPVDEFSDGHYLMMVTRRGWIKRVALNEFAAVRPSGLIALNLEEGDLLGWVRMTQGHDDVVIVTEQGTAIRFNEKDVRPMGRTARGVTAIRLEEGDAITSMEVVEPGGDLFIATVKGYGRRTALDEFRVQSRGGKGVQAYKVTKRTGPVTSARVVQPQDEITLISEGGLILRTPVSRIPQMGRYSQGVALMDLKEGDRVASVARLAEEVAKVEEVPSS
jgi:DNA gyrase subunit A